ncbi:MAG TPA: hypothetical protein VFS47_07810, partial [Steroidobacteraceae bacterium]|nr:hypothetical protein [Steroidobacteraceae bacterium]
MNSTNEFAEQYTKKERLRFVLVGLIVGSAFMLGWEAWVLPRWTEFVRTSPCHEFAGVSGVTLVFYSLFVGLPLSSALLVAAVTTRRGLKILRDRQDPY